jgi:spermidine/putrescine transport system substrate-binding protein
LKRLSIASCGRREFLRRAALLAVAAGLPGCKTHDSVLNFYNWSNYIDPDTIPTFEHEFGAKVNYDNFSSQDILTAKMRIGVFGYDLVVATDYKIAKMCKAGLIEPLDLSKIPNVKNLYPRFRSGPWDPGNLYSIPWQWGTTGIGYNQKMVDKADSWDVMWDPRYAGAISMLDEARDAIGVTLMSLGLDGNSLRPDDLREAQRKLIAQRPLLKHYTSDTYIDELCSNDLALAQGWSGDVNQARSENGDIGYSIPQEGSFIWVDNLCIPKGAPHPELAHEFMNFVLRPDIGANISKFVQYASPNQAAEPYLKDLLADPTIYPPAELMRDKLVFYANLGADEDKWQEVWRQVKIG